MKFCLLLILTGVITGCQPDNKKQSLNKEAAPHIELTEKIRVFRGSDHSLISISKFLEFLESNNIHIEDCSIGVRSGGMVIDDHLVDGVLEAKDYQFYFQLAVPWPESPNGLTRPLLFSQIETAWLDGKTKKADSDQKSPARDIGVKRFRIMP